MNSRKPADKNDETKINVPDQLGRTESVTHSTAPQNAIHALQNKVGNQSVLRLLDSGKIQAKLIIGQPGDEYEQEADHVAEKVLQVSHEATLKKQPATRLHLSKPRRTWLLLPETDNSPVRAEETISRQTDSGSRKSGVSQLIQGSKTALARAIRTPVASVPYRQEMEAAFQEDFSRVRAHTNKEANEATRSLGGRAFTIGEDIVFHDAHPDRSLVAHELAHVVQGGNRRGMHIADSITSEYDATEIEANKIAQAFVNAAPLPPVQIGLSPNTIAGDWGHNVAMSVDISVRYDPELGLVQFLWNEGAETNQRVQDYMRETLGRPLTNGAVLEVSRLTSQLRYDVEMTLGEVLVTPSESAETETTPDDVETEAAGAASTWSERHELASRELENISSDWVERRQDLVDRTRTASRDLENVCVDSISQLTGILDDEIGEQLGQFYTDHWLTLGLAVGSTVAGLVPPAGPILGFLVSYIGGIIQGEISNAQVEESGSILNFLSERVNDEQQLVLRYLFRENGNVVSDISYHLGRIDQMFTGGYERELEDIAGVSSSSVEPAAGESRHLRREIRHASTAVTEYENVLGRLEPLVQGLPSRVQRVNATASRCVQRVREEFVSWRLRDSTLFLTGEFFRSGNSWAFRQRLRRITPEGLSTSLTQFLLGKSWDEIAEQNLCSINLMLWTSNVSYFNIIQDRNGRRMYTFTNTDRFCLASGCGPSRRDQDRRQTVLRLVGRHPINETVSVK